MKYVIIGSSGHHNQVLEAARAGVCPQPAAIAPGCAGEDARYIASKCGARYYEDWRELLDGEAPDLAVVNTWFAYNAGISARCLNMGMHVYSEKPLATETDDLQTLRRAWEKSGKGLGCMLNLNCCAWYKALEGAIQAGEIGEVRLIHGQKSYRLGARGANYADRAVYGGTIPWVAIHAIDWVLRLGGACESVSAAHSSLFNGQNGDMEATAAILLRLENGVIATINADFLRPAASARHDDDRLRVTGTRGMLEAIDGHVYLENERPRRELALPRAENPFERFLQAINTHKADALARSALEDTRVSLLARRAADENRAIPAAEGP